MSEAEFAFGWIDFEGCAWCLFIFFIGEILTEYFGSIDSGLVTFLRYPKCGRGNPPRAVSSLKLLVRPPLDKTRLLISLVDQDSFRTSSS